MGKSKNKKNKSEKKSKSGRRGPREVRNPLVPPVTVEVKRQHAMSRREAFAVLQVVADDLITLCPFSTSPDDVSDALGEFATAVRGVADAIVTRAELRDLMATVESES